ncbi:nitrilotriacetate monooxygenase component B [Geomicrobium sp. JCM 19037]|uniref:flavin reductase family protein n=1 Tax=unclassified Geomicrobium TaxID=2628951 RepID=UPI00045F152C|nr:flavin reductase family protein [Geomicrobium sp. JCM 19037]GAK03806.1 nitrilotriacetate monooxygenase component B [Geomicrobium sp. JCM 19037]
MDDHLFRRAMANFTTGITVVTTENNREIHGMTANAFMSISLEPKLIAISVDHRTNMYKKITQSKRFAVNILDTSQEDISKLFANQVPGKEQFAFADFNGYPVIPEAMVQLLCTTYDEVEAGDHTIFIGEVQNMQLNDKDVEDPLVYYRGAYRSLNEKPQQ